MRKELIERVLNEANHINRTHDTIRKTAKIYGYSKSTVHNDVSVKLKFIDVALYHKTQAVLQENFNEKHLRGGEATRKKYLEEEEKEE